MLEHAMRSGKPMRLTSLNISQVITDCDENARSEIIVVEREGERNHRNRSAVFAFIALTLLIERPEGQLACKMPLTSSAISKGISLKTFSGYGTIPMVGVEKYTG